MSFLLTVVCVKDLVGAHICLRLWRQVSPLGAVIRPLIHLNIPNTTLMRNIQTFLALPYWLQLLVFERKTCGYLVHLVLIGSTILNQRGHISYGTRIRHQTVLLTPENNHLLLVLLWQSPPHLHRIPFTTMSMLTHIRI